MAPTARTSATIAYIKPTPSQFFGGCLKRIGIKGQAALDVPYAKDVAELSRPYLVSVKKADDARRSHHRSAS
jgi:hypothetical protein